MSDLSLVVGEGTEVTLHFSLEFEDGDIVDSNFEKQAPTFTFGDGSLLPGFEEALVGLRPGEKGRFVIPPEKAFGQSNESNVQTVSRGSFDESIELVKGLVISFADPSGGELPGVVKSFDDDEVEVDFNHPLAGRSIVFNVSIIDVKPVVTH